EILSSLAKKYRLNKKLAEQIFDSDYFSIFEEIVGSVKEVSPTFIASKLTEDMINLERRGLDRAVITDELLTDIFKRLDTGTIAKESVISIFEKLMKKEAGTVEDAKMALGITSISDQELDTAIEGVLKENMSIIIEKRFEAVGILMGRSMALLRGRADGHKINSILMKKLEYLLMRANRSGASPSAPV
ncbi:MAG TPA: Glu-tRNA(Gln) amidotransferase GatDE subunit E, partial [Methylomirabilota bacterium]|nr:Glu-tRNA(Gln) amidotransferase GatDE subunit E [Methylomirabilota bacterium]